MTENGENISILQNFLAGGFGGLCLVTAGHPLDTVKVRLQTMPLTAAGKSPIYSGTFDCIRKTFQREGTRGFFKGMSTPFVGVAPLYSLTFFGYSVGKKLQTAPDGCDYTKLQIFNAGALSGALCTVITAPGERIKCLLQIQANSSASSTMYKGPVDCLRQLYRTGGLRSVFRGSFTTLLRDIPGNGVYFASYEALKDHFKHREILPNGDELVKLDPLGTLFAGGMAGILFWVVAIPADVLKSRLQTAPESEYPNGLRDVYRRIVQQEGITALYRGASAVLLRAFPANAAMFGGYELAMHFLDWLSIR